jgi:cobalt-zinc-cadmium efflux system membrane fusion protein
MKRTILFPVFFIALLSSCGGPANEEQAPDDNSDSAENVTITREQFEASGLAFSAMNKVEAGEKVGVSGVVKVFPDKQALVTGIVEGRVSQVLVSEGDWVKKGDRLLQLEGPAIVELQQRFAEVDARLPVLKADFERQRGLFQDQIASEKDFLEARSLYQSALASWSGLQKQLHLINVDTERTGNADFVSSVVITAPIAGNVTDMNAVNGMYVSHGTELLQIADPKAVYVELNVFETDFTGLKTGLRVDIYPAGNTSGSISGTLRSISHKVDDESRSISVQAGVSENDGTLLPGMYVDAVIQKKPQQMYILPREAVVDLEGKTYALQKIKETDTSFLLKRVEIETFSLEGEQIGIKNYDQFDPDAQFLSKGAFTLITE